jgi:hypothetical protein
MRMRTVSAAVVLGLVSSTLVVAAAEPVAARQPATTSTMTRAAADASVTTSLRMMTFNIEEGGTHVAFGKVVEAIRKARADVVTVDEAFGNTRRLARALGWRYVAPRLSIVSRLPILDPAGARGRYVFVQPTPGTVVAVSNVHLPSWPGNTDRILKGVAKAKILRTEREVRLPAIAPTMTALRAVAATGVPVFLQGDMNAPSHQDWTPATVGTFPQIKYPMPWPVSTALAASGFTDSYRVVHPDPVASPGITWPAARPRLPGWNPGKKAPRDRLDQIWSAGPATARTSQVVGEPGAADITVSPWPSDHRAVVSSFDVQAAPTPVTVSVLRPLVRVGKQVRIDLNTGGAAGARLLVVPQGYGTGRDLAARPSHALLSRSLATTSGDQHLTVAARRLGPGAYDAVVIDGSLGELARTTFWVRAKGAGPKVRAASVRSGRPVAVRFARAPGNQWDWVGIYARGAANPKRDSYLDWEHTGGLTAGTVRLTEREDGDSTWPLPPGKYVATLLVDDSYQVLARTRFTIR